MRNYYVWTQTIRLFNFLQLQYYIQETRLPVIHTAFQIENQCKALKSMVSNYPNSLKSVGPLLLLKCTGTIVSPILHSYRPRPHLRPQQFLGFIDVLKPDVAQVAIRFINQRFQEESKVLADLTYQQISVNKINPGSCTNVYGSATFPDDYTRTSISQVGMDSPIIPVPENNGHAYPAVIECMIRSSNIPIGPISGSVEESKSFELEFLLIRKLRPLAVIQINCSVIAPGTRRAMGKIYYSPKQYHSHQYEAVSAKDIVY